MSLAHNIKTVPSRLLQTFVAVVGLVTIVFFATRLVGDPATLLVPPGATHEEMALARGQLGLDKPLLVQYALFLRDAAHGDFGTSFQYGRPAMEVVLQYLPATVELGTLAVILGAAVGIAGGTLAAFQRHNGAGALINGLAMVGQAVPAFWLGLMLILVFSDWLGWLPTGGREQPTAIILPALTLALFVAASVTRFLRASILDVLHNDFVRTARAKGLLPTTIIGWHILRNAVIPVVTMLGVVAGELLGGSVVTETVFAWPGVGRLIIQAVQTQDLPVIQAGVAMIATIFLLVTLLVDILCSLLDPRIDLGARR